MIEHLINIRHKTVKSNMIEKRTKLQ